MLRQPSPLASIVLLAVLTLVGSLAVATRGGLSAIQPAAQSAAQAGVTVEFFGHSHYRLTSPSGKIVLTNPWVTGNPNAVITLDETIARGADLIVVADLHGDERGQALEIAQATGARIVAPAWESAQWFVEMGLSNSQVSRTSPGDLDRYEGITVHVVRADHGSRPGQNSETVAYGGPAAGFMITFENGFTVYFAGEAAATMDMMLWADWYKPDVAIVNQRPQHEVRDSAAIVQFMTHDNPNLKTVFPTHHRNRPQAGDHFQPSDLRAEIQRLGINVNFIEPEPARPYVLTK